MKDILEVIAFVLLVVTLVAVFNGGCKVTINGKPYTVEFSTAK